VTRPAHLDPDELQEAMEASRISFERWRSMRRRTPVEVDPDWTDPMQDECTLAKYKDVDECTLAKYKDVDE